jgi:hypothetical protein
LALAFWASIALTLFFAACGPVQAAVAPSGGGETGNSPADPTGLLDGAWQVSNPAQAGPPDHDLKPGDRSPEVQAQIAAGRTFQWAGVVFETNLEGAKFSLIRGCDRWLLIFEDSEVGQKLRKLVGSKAVIWGRVLTGPSVYQTNTIIVDSVYGPNEPMPQTFVAIPEFPCPDPQPRPAANTIVLQKDEVAAAGDLVWENGAPFLKTLSGNIAITLPVTPGGQPQSGADNAPSSAASVPAMKVVAAGKWSFTSRGLTLAAREVKAWPAIVVAGQYCVPGQVTSAQVRFLLQTGEMAALGGLVRDGSQFILKTASGPIYLTMPNAAGPDDATSANPPEVAVAGRWKSDGRTLHIGVREIRRLGISCGPTWPNDLIRPGEIAAVGNLVWEGGKVWLETPSGRIALTIPAQVESPLGLPGSVSADALAGKAQSGEWGPSANSGDPTTQTLPPPTDTLPGTPQVLVVGKWSIVNGQLTIAVRWAVRWPYPWALPAGLAGLLPGNSGFGQAAASGVVHPETVAVDSNGRVKIGVESMDDDEGEDNSRGRSK